MDRPAHVNQITYALYMHMWETARANNFGSLDQLSNCLWFWFFDGINSQRCDSEFKSPECEHFLKKKKKKIVPFWWIDATLEGDKKSWGPGGDIWTRTFEPHFYCFCRSPLLSRYVALNLRIDRRVGFLDPTVYGHTNNWREISWFPLILEHRRHIVTVWMTQLEIWASDSFYRNEFSNSNSRKSTPAARLLPLSISLSESILDGPDSKNNF